MSALLPVRLPTNPLRVRGAGHRVAVFATVSQDQSQLAIFNERAKCRLPAPSLRIARPEERHEVKGYDFAGIVPIDFC